MTTCKACPDGRFSSEPAQSTCTTCAAQCAAGKYFKANCSSTADIQCDNCAAGNSSNDGAMKLSDCFMCHPGTISTSAGQTCSPCATGRYNPFYGQTACLRCQSGSTSPAGSIAREACKNQISLQCDNVPANGAINSEAFFSHVLTGSTCASCSCASDTIITGTCGGAGSIVCYTCKGSCKLTMSFTAAVQGYSYSDYTTALGSIGSAAVTSTQVVYQLNPSGNMSYTLVSTSIAVTANDGKGTTLSYSAVESNLKAKSITLISFQDSVKYEVLEVALASPTLFVFLKGTASVSEADFKANLGTFKQVIAKTAGVSVDNVLDIVYTVVNSRRASSISYTGKIGVASVVRGDNWEEAVLTCLDRLLETRSSPAWTRTLHQHLLRYDLLPLILPSFALCLARSDAWCTGIACGIHRHFI